MSANIALRIMLLLQQAQFSQQQLQISLQQGKGCVNAAVACHDDNVVSGLDPGLGQPIGFPQSPTEPVAHNCTAQFYRHGNTQLVYRFLAVFQYIYRHGFPRGRLAMAITGAEQSIFLDRHCVLHGIIHQPIIGLRFASSLSVSDAGRKNPLDKNLRPRRRGLNYRDQWVRRALPFARLLASTFLPLRVRMRFMKPCSLLR